MDRRLRWVACTLTVLLVGTPAALLGGRPMASGGVGSSTPSLSTWAQPLSGGLSQGWTHLATGLAPTARANASSDFDETLGGVVLFGGWNGSYLGDTWLYRSGGWSPLVNVVHPSARAGGILVFDPGIAASVLFGGDGGTPLGDTWILRGGTWSSLNLSPSPPARSGAVAGYDPFAGGVVLFGGTGTNGALSDTWLFTGTSWQLLSESTHPMGLAYAAFTADPSDGDLVLYGGIGSMVQSATWEFHGGGWTRLSPSHPPPARSAAGFTYDTADGFAVLFGGRSSSPLGTTWSFENGSWTALNPTTHPSSRSAMAMVNDPADGYVLLFGGVGSGWLGDTWAYKVRVATPQWTNLGTPGAPHQREQGVTAYDPLDGYTVLFGGWNSSAVNLSRAFYGDTWTYKGGVWTQLHPGTAPSPRRGAMMVFDPIDGYLVLYGGSNATVYLNDTWTFRGGAWAPLHPTLAPPVRRSGAIAFDAADGYVVLFGGHNGSTVLSTPSTPYQLRDDSWSFLHGAWTRLGPPTHPSARSEPEMDFDAADGYLVLFGGYIQHRNGLGDIEQSDTWEFLGGAWSNLSAQQSLTPPARDGEVLTFDSTHGSLLMLGGDHGNLLWSDSWYFRGGHWSQICANCSSAYRPGSHAAFDASDGYVVYLGGNGKGQGATVAWVAPLGVKVPKPGAGDVGIPIAFHATVNGAELPLRYAWAFADGNRSTSATPSERFPAPGSYSVTLALVDASGNAATATVTAVVQPAPQAEASADPSSTDVGGSVAFSAAVTGGLAPYGFHWTFGDGSTNDSASPVHAFAAPGAYPVGVTVTDAVGGRSQSSVVESVSGGPVPSIQASRNATDVGIGVTFNATVVNGTGPETFAWNFGDGGNATGPTVAHVFGTAGSYVVAVSVTDAVGSDANASVTEDVTPALQASLVVPGRGESGAPSDFSANLSGGAAPIQVSWTFGDGNSSTNLTGAHTYSVPGNYTVVFEAADAAGGTFQGNRTIDVAPALGLQVDQTPSGVVAPDANITFSVNVSGGWAPFNASWSFGDGGNGSGATVVHAYLARGFFTVNVTVYDALGMQATVSLTVHVADPAGARRRTDPPVS